MEVAHFIFTLIWFLLACVCTGFVLWRKLRRERVDNEDQIFDSAALAAFGGIILGRLVFVIFHWGSFGFRVAMWLAAWQYPGTVDVVSVVGGLFLFWKLLRNEWKDTVEQVDYTSIALAFFLFLMAIGDVIMQLLQIGANMVRPTTMLTPMFDVRLLIVSLLYVVMYGCLFLFLSNVEKNYRTFLWYRARRRSAQTGFVVACFLIGYGFFGFVLSWFTPMNMVVLGIGLDPLLKLLVMVIGFVLLYIRSGKSLFRQSS